MNCTCVFCEVDRENSRQQYVAQWRDTGAWYDADGFKTKMSTTRDKATRFGPRHKQDFGPAFRMVEA